METIEFVKNNFLGMSCENQRIVLENLLNSLEENKMKKLLKGFNKEFLDYFEKINDLLLFKEVYKSFNSDKRRLARKIVLDELIKQVDYHHIDNSDKRRIGQFIYSSEEFSDLCKIDECRRYFKQQFVSSELVQKFLVDYSNLSIERKGKFIEEMLLYYDRLSYFSLPNSDNTRQEYRLIFQNLLGDELIEYYDALHSEEQMQLIIDVVDYFKWFKYDNNYYNGVISEMRKDSKFIRRLKKETIYSCHRILNKK